MALKSPMACVESAGKDAKGSGRDMFVLHHTALIWREGRVKSRQSHMAFPGARSDPRPTPPSEYHAVRRVAHNLMQSTANPPSI